VHRYRALCRWAGSTGGGYLDYSRDHDGSTPPAETSLVLSADPAFEGDPRLMNPEQLVVLAAASCQLLSFLASAALSQVDVLAYEGVMPEGDRPERITAIALRPRIVVAQGTDPVLVRRLVDMAHRNCYVANSLNCEVAVEPEIAVAGA